MEDDRWMQTSQDNSWRANLAARCAYWSLGRGAAYLIGFAVIGVIVAWMNQDNAVFFWGMTAFYGAVLACATALWLSFLAGVWEDKPQFRYLPGLLIALWFCPLFWTAVSFVWWRSHPHQEFPLLRLIGNFGE